MNERTTHFLSGDGREAPRALHQPPPLRAARGKVAALTAADFVTFFEDPRIMFECKLPDLYTPPAAGVDAASR